MEPVKSWLRISFCMLLIVLGGQASSGQETGTPAGVVVESLVQGSEGEKAGIQAGDIILRWTRGDVQGEIRSPFDLSTTEIERAPTGTVLVEGLHGMETKTWQMGQDRWGIQARPSLPNAGLTLYRDGMALAMAGKLSEATEKWRTLVDQGDGSRPPWWRTWLIFHLAALQAEARHWQESDQAYQGALQGAGEEPSIAAEIHRAWGSSFVERSDWEHASEHFLQALASDEAAGSQSFARAIDLDNLGRVAHKQGQLPKAGDYYQQALRLRERLAPESLAVAGSLNHLGDLADDRGELDTAENLDQRALAMAQKLAPGSLTVAEALANLGDVALDRGKLAPAKDYYNRSLEIRERLAPGSLDSAGSLNNLGVVAYQRGDLGKTDEYYRKALAIKEKLAPGSLDLAKGLNNLGVVARQRGDLATAEKYHRQALAIQEKLGPASLDIAASFTNLGLVAWERGDLAKADEHYHQALAIREKLAPGSLGVAYSLNNLVLVALQRGDLAEAEEFAQRSYDIHQRLAPESLAIEIALSNLGMVARERGDLAKAEEKYQKALSIQEKLAPGSGDTARNLDRLALVLEGRGDLDGAEQCYRKALVILDKLAPGSANQADALFGMASIQRQRRQLDAAAQFYGQAVEALEKQTGRLGGSNDLRAGFRAKYGKHYQDYASVLIQQGKTDQAFQVLERSRARTLLEMLAASRLDIRRGADPALLQKEHSLRENLAARSDRRIQLLAEKNSNEQIKSLEKEISDLTHDYQEVEAQIRAQSPAYAALTQPQPVSAETVERLLPPDDTLLLEYSLGESRSYVFAITRSWLRSYELAKSGVIEPLAKRLYQSFTARSRAGTRETAQQMQARLAKADAESRRAAVRLSRIVLGPVADELKNRRLLIVSDGALEYVPFAALPIPGPSPASSKPLIAAHEIVNLPSASVLAELQKMRKARGSSATKEVAVLADPVFDKHDSRVRLNSLRGDVANPGKDQRALETKIGFAESTVRFADTLARSAADAGVRPGQRGQLFLPRLAFTRNEAKAVLSVVPPGSSRGALGFDASRSLAISGELAQYRVVHFATHALVDNIHPELSGLVLSLVDRTGHPVNGFVDLEDIYNLDLSADLVVLSACKTALGKEINGEGMTGLTRGFMYAGAPRIIATLWDVDDFATAKLMARFYRAMEREGMKPAEALRQAQLGLWKEHSSSVPYYWAGFILQGDWE